MKAKIKLAGVSVVLMTEKILRIAIAFILVLAFSEYLSPEKFGLMCLVVAFFTIISATSASGWDTVLVGNIVEKPEKEKLILGTALWIRLAFSLAILFLIPLVLVFSEASNELIVCLCLIGLCGFFQAFDIIDCYYQSQSNYLVNAKIRMVSQIIGGIVKFTMVAWFCEPIAISFGYVLESTVLALLLVMSARKNGIGLAGWAFDWSEAVRIISAIGPMLISGIAVSLIMQVDKLIISYIDGDQSVGVYTVATQFSGIWNILPIVVGGVFYPRLVGSKNSDIALYERNAMNLMKFCSAVGVLICVITVACGSKLILLVFGEKFIESAIVLSIHIWTVVFIFHISIRTRLMVVDRNVKFIPIFSILTLLVSVLVCYVLTINFGIEGSAVASVISWGCAAVLIPLFFRKTRKYSYNFFRSLSIG